MRKLIVVLIIGGVIIPLLLIACKKNGQKNIDNVILPEEKKPVKASVSTFEIENIADFAAIGGGKILNNGSSAVTARGLCWSTKRNPSINDDVAEANSVAGSGEFKVELTNLKHSMTYYVRAYAISEVGVSYGNEVEFKTKSIQPVSFISKPMFIVGSSLAAYDWEISDNWVGKLLEQGVCWGEQLNPTVEDNKIISKVGKTKERYTITGLSEVTSYYLRPYVINEEGVYYGENIAFKTIAKGNLTYTFNKEENPTSNQLAVYERLQVAIDSAVWYVNNYTSVTKHVWINYDPNVPTADANNEGWMRFGASSDFQNLRTMLHELNHTFGTGTTSWWSNVAIKNGVYQLTNASQLLKLITGNNAEELKGDGMHWWPYGLNYNSEVTSSWDYVYNCLLIEGMRKDGLTHAGKYIL